jgi:rubrerythrin
MRMDTLLQLHNKAVGKSMQQEQRRSRFSRFEAAASDFRCEGCGYQIAIAEPHPVCPMCGRGSWAPITAARELAAADRRRIR